MMMAAICWAEQLPTSSTPSIQPLECEMYLAESTIPNAGLGIFTAKERRVGDAVGSGDVCFPLLELDIHNTQDPSESFFNPFVDYVWDGEVMGMKFEAQGDQVSALWPGLDCAINCNIPLTNVKRAFPTYSTFDLDRSKHPTAGAMTPYRKGITKVSKDIPAGGELFKVSCRLYIRRNVKKALLFVAVSQ